MGELDRFLEAALLHEKIPEIAVRAQMIGLQGNGGLVRGKGKFSMAEGAHGIGESEQIVRAGGAEIGGPDAAFVGGGPVAGQGEGSAEVAMGDAETRLERDGATRGG